MKDYEIRFLIDKCKYIRYLTMDEFGKLGVGHAGPAGYKCPHHKTYRHGDGYKLPKIL